MKILILLAACALLNSCKKTREVNYLFKQGDSGWFVILYDADNPKKIETGNGNAEFDFTKNHVLETSLSPMFGSYKLNVWIVDDAGNKRFLENNLYSIYPSRYVEEVVGGRSLSYQEFHFGKDDGKGDARAVLQKYLSDVNGGR